MTRRGGLVAALGALAGLSACVSVRDGGVARACPAGNEARRTAQLYFGRNIGGRAGVSDADFQAFVDRELTPRFPEGLTVLDGGGQWRGPENYLVREASKVVMVVLPKARDADARIDAVRAAYKTRFHQDAVLVVSQAACVSF